LWRFGRCRSAGKVSFVKSRAVNVEENQEGAVKRYHPGHQGNNCYNILMAFYDELKALCVLGIHTPLIVLPK